MTRFTSFFVLFLLSSCNLVYFSEPVPGNKSDLIEMPEEMRGTWVYMGDTLAIFNKGYMLSDGPDSMGEYESDSTEWERQYVYLGDSVRLRKVSRSDYIMNIFDKGSWMPMLIHMDNGMIVFRLMSQEELPLLAEVTGIDSIAGLGRIHTQEQDTQVHVDRQDVVLNMELRSRQVRKFILKGGYTDTLLLLRPEYRIPTILE